MPAGRPQKNVAAWFQHDADASDDTKILYLEGEFGPAGYMLYFKFLERLCRCEGFKMPWGDIEAATLSRRFGVDIATIKAFIVAATNINVGAFRLDNGVLWSEGLLKRMAPMQEKRQKEAERIAQKRAEKLTKEDNSLGNGNVGATNGQNRIEENRIEENILKEKKEESVAASAALPNFDVDDEFEYVETIAPEPEKRSAKTVPLEAKKSKESTSKGGGRAATKNGASQSAPPPLIHQMRDVFEQEHQRHFPCSFAWEPKEFKALKTLSQNLARQYREHNRTDEATDEQILSTWRAFLQKTAAVDRWYLDNCFTPSGLSCHYQKIVNKLTHANVNHTARTTADENLQRAYIGVLEYLESPRAS